MKAKGTVSVRLHYGARGRTLTAGGHTFNLNVLGPDEFGKAMRLMRELVCGPKPKARARRRRKFRGRS